MAVISRELSAGQLYDKKNQPTQGLNQITRIDPYSKRSVTHHEWTWVLFPGFKTDYRYYVPHESDSFTAMGEKYLNENIGAFCYTILGPRRDV